MVDEEVLGCDREGVEPARAQEKHPGVWQGVEGEVGPVLRGRSPLGPREGKAASPVPCTKGPVVWCVAVKGRSWQGGGDPCGRWG